MQVEATHAAAASRWQSHTPPFFAYQDGMEVNSGAFLARGKEFTNYTTNILDRWWDLQAATGGWSVHDQGALAAAVLEYATLYTGFRRRHGKTLQLSNRFHVITLRML